MAFTGKATYSAGATLPELAEDVADLVSIVSPYETPLLDHLGDPPRPAASTYHEWLEDELLPNTDAINDATWTDPAAMQPSAWTTPTASAWATRSGPRTAASCCWSRPSTPAPGRSPSPAATAAPRRRTWPTTRCCTSWATPPWKATRPRPPGSPTASARATGRRSSPRPSASAASDLAVRKVAVSDELDYQKQERLRELLRDLESTVINGDRPDGQSPGQRHGPADDEGASSRR